MRRFLSDMKKYWRWIVYAGQAELRAEVASSYLNWLWWIIEPICFMLIYSFVFGLLFGSTIEHIQIFVFIGITMWDFISRMLNSSVNIVRSNKSIVTKVYIPKYMLLLEKMYVNGFKMLIAFIILFIMIIVTRVPFTWYMLWIIPVLLVFFLLTFAIGTFLLHFGVYVSDLANIVRIVLRVVFYVTGVFYDLIDRLSNIVNEHIAILIGNFNPAASLISSMRNALMYQTTPNLRFLLLWFIVGLGLAIGGVALIYKNENNYVKAI